MICGRLPFFIASFPDSVGSCTFIIIRMLALLMLRPPTGARRIRATAKALRTGSPTRRDPDCQRAPPGTRPREPTPATQHASRRPASPPARPAAHRPHPEVHAAERRGVGGRTDQPAAPFAPRREKRRVCLNAYWARCRSGSVLGSSAQTRYVDGIRSHAAAVV